MPASVVVIGGGVVGENAIQMAAGLGGDVVVLDRSVPVLNRLARHFGNSLETVYSTRAAVEELVLQADLVIGAVLVKGDRAPTLVTADMVRRMKPGSVLVDVAIDQGGCFETSRPTTHEDPTYVVDDVVHYCVANMPGAVPQTSTHALEQCNAPLRVGARRQGGKAGDARRSPPARRLERVRRSRHRRARRDGARLRLRRSGDGARGELQRGRVGRTRVAAAYETETARTGHVAPSMTARGVLPSRSLPVVLRF